MAKPSDQNDTSGIPAKQLVSCGDVACELMVDPIPRPTPEPIEILLKPTKAKVTFLDHHKPNSKLIMQMAQEELRKRNIEVEAEIRIKDDASTRMPDALLQSFKGEPGLVLCGISD